MIAIRPGLGMLSNLAVVECSHFLHADFISCTSCFLVRSKLSTNSCCEFNHNICLKRSKTLNKPDVDPAMLFKFFFFRFIISFHKHLRPRKKTILFSSKYTPLGLKYQRNTVITSSNHPLTGLTLDETEDTAALTITTMALPLLD